jgi:hypothetical protein
MEMIMKINFYTPKVFEGTRLVAHEQRGRTGKGGISPEQDTDPNIVTIASDIEKDAQGWPTAEAIRKATERLNP